MIRRGEFHTIFDTMLDRIEQKQGIRPHRLAADKAYGTGPFLAWLSGRKITSHIPVLDRQQQTGGLLIREASPSTLHAISISVRRANS
jgi:hypothetical protein